MGLDRGMHPRNRTAPSDRFTDDLRSQADGTWDELGRHPFVRRLASDTLDDETFRTYLVQEHAMLDPLTRLVAHAMARGGGPAEHRALAGLLQRLTGDLDGYFHRHLESTHAAPSPQDLSVLHTASAELRQLMVDIVAREGYEESLALLLACLWSTHGWASPQGDAEPRVAFREWLRFWGSDANRAVVEEGIRPALDERAPRLPAERQGRVRALFRWGVELQVHILDASLVARAPLIPVSSEPGPPSLSPP